MAQLFRQFFIYEEYLVLEEKANHKSEYYQGEIFQMAGGTPKHNLITSNINANLNFGLRGQNCGVFSSDLRIQVKDKEFFTYADVVVVCGHLEFAPDREDTITNPTVIIEVLLKSTQNYDRSTKFELYRALKSLQHYVIVHQKRVYVESYRKVSDEEWLLRTYDTKTDSLELVELSLTIPLADIYCNVEFAAAPSRRRRPRIKP